MIVLRYCGPVALAAAMLAAAELTGLRAVLFPEAVALAYGVWTLRRDAWCRPLGLVGVPAACALIGLGCALAPGPVWARSVVALVAAVTLLRLARSPLIPAVSAALLPVVFDVRDPVYVVAVLVWCGVLALTTALTAALTAARRDPVPPVVWPWPDLLRFLVAGAAWIAAAGPAGLPPLVVAPPLLVAGLEFTVRRGRLRSWSAPRRILLMTAAGVAGAGAVASGLPGWLGGATAVALVVAAATALREPLTPAAALALVPFVAGTGDPWLVGGAFLTGGVVLTVLPALPAALTALTRGPGAAGR